LTNRQFFTFKFKSSRLKEFNYDTSLTFEEAQEYGEVISLFDNQILRSIRDIHNRHVDYDNLNNLHKEINMLKNKEHSVENSNSIKNIQIKINSILFIPEYITIVMEHPSHYKYLYKNGLKLNDKLFRRFSSSAGQARVSTVTFCETETADKLDTILDNGRKLDKELVPSKFNAYKGVYGSATSEVSTPRFCLVPDYNSDTKVKVNFVTETNYESDDIIEMKEIMETFNRFDGQGLISYEMASKWAAELGLDYVPAQWCVRNSFLKGMLNTFPIHEFCEKINNGNYRIRTSYKDENGNQKIVDLRDIDVIISESQFKLWDSFDSVEVYQENCKKNNIKWGVSLHSPKKDKDILKMNYQFLQTLNLNKQDIEKVSEKFVDWITGVTSKNVYYTMLFLLGNDVTEEKILKYLHKGENNWIKSLIVNPELINDKFIKKKVYDLIKRKIKNGCLGRILIEGNFQTLVSDPFAMMQHICGLEVTGLLKENEYYSNYWNQKDVKVVDSMRAPLTSRSEHLLLNLKQSKELDDWYRHNYTGIIVNAHGHETMNWAGSDWDYDIIATTSNSTIIKGVYRNELPVVYAPPNSHKRKLTNDDLFNADLFSFGSIIGSITNKSTSAYALLPLFKDSSEEYKITMNRIQMCTKLQSAQIDKAKIGRQVKGIPSNWIKRQKISDNDSNDDKQKKEIINKTLLEKHPYFFIYLYKGTNTKYKNHVKRYNITCQQKFGMDLEELRNIKRKTKEQHEFLHLFDEFSPVFETDCVMNNLCKYIESVDFGIRNIINNHDEKHFHKSLMSSEDFSIDIERYELIIDTFNTYKKKISKLIPATQLNESVRNGFDEGLEKSINGQYEKLKLKLIEICSYEKELVDYLIYLFYVDQPNSNKEILWNLFGHCLFDNVKRNNVGTFSIPIPDEKGEIVYLNKNYSLKEVLL
jgi:hypothetical protein